MTRQAALFTAKWIIAIVSAIATIIPLYIALARLRYPYDLEWLEGGMLEQVRWVHQGNALFAPPSVDFVQFVYPPVYTWAAAALSGVLGVEYSTLRLISIAATLGTFWLIYKLVKSETGNWSAGVLAVGLYAVTYRFTGAWFDLGKSDSLFLLMVFGSLYLLKDAVTKRQALIAGAVMAAAVLTKQNALIVALPAVCYVAIARWKVAAVYSAVVAVIVGVASLILNATSNGWFNYFIWEQLFQHGEAPGSMWDFWTRDMMHFVALVPLVLAAIPAWIKPEKRWKMGFYLLAAGGLVASAWASRLHSGGFENVLMPACLAIAIFAGLAFAELMEQKRTWVFVVGVVLCLAQFNEMRYDISNQIPTAADREAGDAFIARVRGIEGDVLVPSHPTYAAIAGKPSHASQGAVVDILRATANQPKEVIRASYAKAIHDQRFAAIFFDGQMEADVFPSDWKNYYQQVPVQLFASEDVFIPVCSPTGHPTEMWVPIPR